MTSAAAPNLQALASSPVFEELLIRADRAVVVASLARGLAHDLRGPLQTLTLLIDPHADIFGGMEGARLRTAVGESIQHLTDTVGRFGQIYAANDPPPEAAPIIIDDLLTYVAELQRYQRGWAAVEVDLRLPPGLPPVRGIESHLRHVLLSLLLNAKEALVEREEPRIVMAAGTRDGAVEILVENNGPALDPRAAQRAFEPFFTTRPGHLGLGLPVARWLVERMGGSLALTGAGEAEGGAVVVQLLLPAWRRAGV
ncbi:MAG TPA: ATP-binding protein [Gemmatimonadales bacterium]|nr:ATP-binding protein [Gemmatimonadales bacterium]